MPLTVCIDFFVFQVQHFAQRRECMDNVVFLFYRASLPRRKYFAAISIRLLYP